MRSVAEIRFRRRTDHTFTRFSLNSIDFELFAMMSMSIRGA